MKYVFVIYSLATPSLTATYNYIKFKDANNVNGKKASIGKVNNVELEAALKYEYQLNNQYQLPTTGYIKPSVALKSVVMLRLPETSLSVHSVTTASVPSIMLGESSVISDTSGSQYKLCHKKTPQLRSFFILKYLRIYFSGLVHGLPFSKNSGSFSKDDAPAALA